MALSGGYMMDADVLVLGDVPYVLRQEPKTSRALEKATVLSAICSPCLKLNPSFEMGWVRGAAGCCHNTVLIWGWETNFFPQGWMRTKRSKHCPLVTNLEKQDPNAFLKKNIPCLFRCLQCSCHFSLQTPTILATQLIALWKVNLSQAFSSLWLIANLIIIWLLLP